MTITFSFAAPTGHDIDIEWYHNDMLVVDGTFDGVVVSGATTEVLTITNPTSAWNGVYFARVIDHTADCTVDSDPVVVTVPATCDLAITVQPVDVNTTAGNDIELSVAYTGEHGTVTFQWYKDGLELEDGAQAIGTVSGALTDTLTIASATEDAEGSYTVILVDDGIADCSVESDAATVSVATDCDLLITSQPESSLVLNGGTLELTFAYTGTGGPFTIQWFLDNVPLVDGASGGSTIAGATTDTLTITDWTSALAGAYYAVVTDTATVGCVAQTATAVVTLLEPPENMYIWYDAYQETAFSDGDLALPWQDWSGFEHDAVNYTDITPVQPTYQTGVLNGLPIFDWDGPADDQMGLYTDPFDLPGSGFPVTSTGYTFAIVVNRRNESIEPTFNDLTVAALNDSAATRGRLNAVVVGSDCTWVHRGFDAASTACQITVPVDGWQIITGTFDFVEGIPRLKTNDDEATGGTSPGTVLLNLAQMQLCPEGKIAEVLYYNVKLPDAQLAAVRTYLSEKWGIPITV